MGINIGDIIVDGIDVIGDAVNVAARLEGLAGPGGICISGDAFRHLQGKFDVAFDERGLQTLKNIDQPVAVYDVRLESLAVAKNLPVSSSTRQPAITSGQIDTTADFRMSSTSRIALLRASWVPYSRQS